MGRRAADEALRGLAVRGVERDLAGGDDRRRRAQSAYYRRLTPSARVELAMSEDARAITAAGIQHRHPEYTAEQVRHALLRLLLGDDLFHRAWPHAPLLAP